MNRLTTVFPLMAFLAILASCSDRAAYSVSCLDGTLALKETYGKAFLDKVGALKNMRAEGMPFAEEYRLN